VAKMKLSFNEFFNERTVQLSSSIYMNGALTGDGVCCSTHRHPS